MATAMRITTVSIDNLWGGHHWHVVASYVGDGWPRVAAPPCGRRPCHLSDDPFRPHSRIRQEGQIERSHRNGLRRDGRLGRTPSVVTIAALDDHEGAIMALGRRRAVNDDRPPEGLSDALPSWSDFVQRLSDAGALPTPDVQPTARIGDLAPTGVQRALLLTAVRHFGGLPVDLVPAIATLGEAYDWCRQSWERDGLPAPLPAPRVRLRPLRRADFADLYQAALDPGSSYRWRYRGNTPWLQDFERSLFVGTLCVLAVESNTDRQLVGTVFSYDANHSDGHSWIAFQRSSAANASGLMYEAMFLFVDYLFATWPLRKLYAEIPDYNLANILPSEASFAHEEGRLKDHTFHGGRWWMLPTWQSTGTNGRPSGMT